MMTSRLTFELDWAINPLPVDYPHAMNWFRYYAGTPISIKRIEHENKQNNNIY